MFQGKGDMNTYWLESAPLYSGSFTSVSIENGVKMHNNEEDEINKNNDNKNNDNKFNHMIICNSKNNVNMHSQNRINLRNKENRTNVDEDSDATYNNTGF